MYEFGNLIDGRWLNDSGATCETFNPALPNARVGVYHQADSGLVDAALEAASRAQRLWRAVPVGERLGIVANFIAGVERHTEQLAAAITAEQGKPLAESRGEIAKACSEGRHMLAHVMEASGNRAAASVRPNVRNMIIRRPRGVIVAIAPWNFPVMTPMRKLVPALAFGNAILLKPSEFTPAAACMLGEIGREWLPPGLLQILHGGPLVGDMLVRHGAVQGVTFTGSVPTGRKILAATASNLAEAALELGGKNAAVIHDADDIERCLDQVAQAAWLCSGQRCTAVSRVLVRTELVDAVVDGLSRRANALILGNGALPDTQLGPITHASQLAHIEALVASGIEEGAKLAAGGKRVTVPGCEGGHFFAPTVLRDVLPSMRVAREEIFGPVISVLACRDIDRAIDILNDVEFGLTAALFSNDARVISRFIDECETGMMHVNHGTIPDSHMPFGGIKSSGLGAYSVGASAANFYTTEHAVYVGI
jgi:alpha-ketoglutaric semialdehyde dehydrogenase